MKTIKSILIAATLISASVVSTLSAQQAAQPAPKHEFKVALGDSVMIKRECQKYCTGETPSTWVWDKVHTVRQLGTKRFPDGVLLMNIYSWMCEDCLIPVNGHATEAAKVAAEEQKEEREAFESGKPVEETKPAEQPAPTPAEEAKPAEEPAQPAPVVEPAPAEQPAEEPAPAEEAKPEDSNKPVVVVEQVKGDSIKSQQNFRGGYDRFTIGLRGGVSSLLHSSETGKWNIGGDVILDLQYAHYWTKEGRPVDLGIITGIGIGYAQSSLNSGVNTDTLITDQEQSQVHYTMKADDVREHDGQLQLEVPLMFSLIHENGLFFNIGPKFMIPVYTPYKQTISNNQNTYINAYFPETGVDVTNDEFVGMLGNMTENGSDYGNKFTINIMLAAEIGYEWILKSGNSLGLGAYANYSVYNSFSNKGDSNKPLIDVQGAGSQAAVVTVNPLTKTYANKLGYFDVGVKLAYHFNFPKKRQNKDARLY